MADQQTTIARRISQLAQEYPNRSAMAFDGDGKLIDWREMDDSGWVNGSHEEERLYVVSGGATEASVQQVIDRADG